MLTLKGFDRSALIIATLSAMTPLLLPSPGLAVQVPQHLRRHVISNNVVQKLQQEGNFRMFLEALRVTGMQYPLETGRGPYTIFAPNDRAFASLSKDTFTKLFQDKARLKQIVKYHIVQKRLMSSNIKFDSLRTLTGDFLMTNINSAKTITVSSALINKPDITCRNGVIHSIDTVLFPLTGMENLAMNESSNKAGDIQ